MSYQIRIAWYNREIYTYAYGSWRDLDNIVEDIIVYPNPFLDILYFKEEENIEVRDILGKIIFSSVSINQIETSAWDTGVYFISLKERKKTLKVIKIK